MSRNDAERAEFSALARMFRCWPTHAVRDGRDLVNEAIGEDADFRKVICRHLEGAFKDGGEVDHCALGRDVADRLIAYAKALPRFDDYRAEEEAGLCEPEEEGEA